MEALGAIGLPVVLVVEVVLVVVPVVAVVLVVPVVAVVLVVPVVAVVLVVPVVAVVLVVPVVAVVLVVPVVDVVEVVLVVPLVPVVVVLVQVLYSWQRGTKNPRHPVMPRRTATTQMEILLRRATRSNGSNCFGVRSTILLVPVVDAAQVPLCPQLCPLHGTVLHIQHSTNGMDDRSDADRGNHGFFRDSLLPQHVLMRVNTLAATVYRGGSQTP